jgi:hypothetical protein
MKVNNQGNNQGNNKGNNNLNVNITPFKHINNNNNQKQS